MEEALGHAYPDEPNTTVPATCENDGLKTFVCANGCGIDKTEVITAIGHAYPTEPTTTIHLVAGGDLNITDKVVAAGGADRDYTKAFLDIAHQLQLMQQARALAAEGKTVVLVLHDLSMALGCADSMAVMSEGKCLFQGSPEDVFLSRCLDAAFGVEMQRFRTPNGWKYCWNGKHIP